MELKYYGDSTCQLENSSTIYAEFPFIPIKGMTKNRKFRKSLTPNRLKNSVRKPDLNEDNYRIV